MKYVCGFCIGPDLKDVILIKKTRPDWQKGLLNGVGGKIEPNETPYEAMVRKFKEETGANLTEWYEFANLIDHGNEIICFFAVASPIVTTMTDEEVNYHSLFTTDAEKVVPSILWLIPLALDRIKNPHSFVVANIFYNKQIGTHRK